MTHQANGSSSLNNAVTLPDIEEIERTEQLQQEAIKALEVSDGFVKCQKCGSIVPISRKLTIARTAANYAKIASLEKQIKYLERYHNNDSKELKAELEELLRKEEEDEDEEDKDNLLRSIPLYSGKITGFRFYCSTCYDKAYYRRRTRKNKET